MISEVFKMYKYPSMIKAASFCAAVFALLAVIFKNAIVFIPEVSEVRLCNAVAISFGIWFGPAGAWGCAVGNLIGDLDGSLTWLTLPGFFGNFMSAWLPYKVWGILNDYFGEDFSRRPGIRSYRSVVIIAIMILLSVVSCCSLLCICFDLYPVMPAANSFCMLALNNVSASILGILLFWGMSFIPEAILPYWKNLMKDEKGMYFPKEHLNKLRIIVIGSVIYSLLMVFYMFYKKASLFVMDTYSNVFPIGLSVIFVVFIVVMTSLCRWKESRVELTL